MKTKPSNSSTEEADVIRVFDDPRELDGAAWECAVGSAIAPDTISAPMSTLLRYTNRKVQCPRQVGIRASSAGFEGNNWSLLAQCI